MGLYDVINYFNYTPTNSSIDIVVIEHPDGSLKGSPFHVNFGFGSVLRSKEKIVCISVNDEMCDIQMRLGKSGEAYFVEKNSIDEMISPPDTPKKEFCRQISQTSTHSRKHSRSAKITRSKTVESSSDLFQDAFDPSCALSDSEYEVNRPQLSHSVPSMGYLSDPEITCDDSDQLKIKDKAKSHVTVWKWGKLPETTSSETSTVVDTSTMPTEQNSITSIKSDEPHKDDELDSSTHKQLDNKLSQTELCQPNSPPRTDVDDEIQFGLDRGMQLSICGGLDGDINPEEFEKHMISWEVFMLDPKTVLENPNLVIKEGDRYLNWTTCAAIAVSKIFFDQELPHDTVDRLKTPKRNHARTSWSIFGFRSTKHKEKQNEHQTIGQPLDNIEGNNNDPKINVEQKKHVGKTLLLNSYDLKKLNLQPGKNKIEFQVITKFQGTAKTEAAIYLWKSTDRIVVSDIDGTVTKSDVVGHISNVFYIDYTHKGIHNLYHQIEKNGYKFVYLSSRGISQSSMTKTYINWTKKDGRNLPYGPILLNPSSLISALLREVWTKNPEEFKIDCLSGIANLFPNYWDPFYAGFGNKSNDEKAYRTVKIPDKRIFTIDKKGVVKSSDLSLSNFSTSYERLEQVVDFFFPPICQSISSASLRHLSNTFWRIDVPDLDFDAELAAFET